MRYVIATYTKGDEYHIYVVYCLRWLLPVLDIIPSLHARYFITAAVWFLLKFVRTENCNLCIAEHDSVSPVAPDANNSPRDSPTLLISPLRVSHCCGGDGGRFFFPKLLSFKLGMSVRLAAAESETTWKPIAARTPAIQIKMLAALAMNAQSSIWTGWGFNYMAPSYGSSFTRPSLNLLLRDDERHGSGPHRWSPPWAFPGVASIKLLLDRVGITFISLLKYYASGSLKLAEALIL